MKKTFALPALLCIFTMLFTFSSCNEIQDIDVDFGGRSYINDYSQLIKIINNKDSTMIARFDALNKLVESGMANLKLSIDRNTGAITVLNQTTKDGLDSIQASLFSNFSVLTRHMDAQRDSIVNAINKNGQDLRARIDYNGNLISTQILSSTEAEKSIKNAIDSLKLEVVNENLTQNAYLAQIVNTLAILNKLDSTIIINDNANRDTILATIKKISSTASKALSTEGIEIAADDSAMYIVPEIWSTIENKDSTSYLYKACLNAIKKTAFFGTVKIPDNTKRGWTGNDNSFHNGTGGYYLDLSYNSNTMLSGNALVVADTITPPSLGRKCVKLVKMPEDAIVSLNAVNSTFDCNSWYHYYYVIRVYDVRGDYQVFGAVTGSRDEIGNVTDFQMPKELIKIDTGKNSTDKKYSIKLKLCSKGKTLPLQDTTKPFSSTNKPSLDNTAKFKVYLWEVATSKDGSLTMATGTGVNAAHGDIKWASEY